MSHTNLVKIINITFFVNAFDDFGKYLRMFQIIIGFQLGPLNLCNLIDKAERLIKGNLCKTPENSRENWNLCVIAIGWDQ